MKKKKQVILYALSTCVWCKRTKRLLNEIGVEYEAIDVDLLKGNRQREIREIVCRLNPDLSYPVLVVDDTTVIAGFDEDRIRLAFE